MKSIKMDFVRSGEDPAVLVKGVTYHVVVESSQHRQFHMPLSQEEFLDRLAELRYHEAIEDDQRRAALRKLSTAVTDVLKPPEPLPGDGVVQLDLVTNARELWALPFEAALAPDGQPLFARRAPAVVLTRRAPQEFAERRPNWPARPRILFAHASPEWMGGDPVPSSGHKDALLKKALQPWVEPLPDQPEVIPQETSVLTTLDEASLGDIESACRRAEAEGRPYTHVHLLAHGVKIEDPIRPHKTRYGIALRSDDQIPTEPEALVRTLRPPRARNEPGPEMPVVVTLAICDAGNAANTIIEAGGVAQELHRAGIPVVVASQLPLTFSGSEIMTRVFYEGWMDGKDVRAALHDTRVALYETEGVGHDWVSLVAYVRLPEGYDDYLFDVRLVSQLAALETASNHAGHLLEHGITADWQYDQVTDRLGQRVELLEGFLNEHDAVTYKPQGEVVQENTGLLGSAYKRLAELLDGRAATDPEHRERWTNESRSALKKARDVYRDGFQRNISHHWSGVQYLALDTVLAGRVTDIGAWYACYLAATAQRDHEETSEKDRIWALGSIAELGLLASLTPEVSFLPKDAAAALTDLRTRVEASPGMFTELSPVVSTRRQLMRYVDWWTKDKDFFEASDSDLAEEAEKLVKVLES